MRIYLAGAAAIALAASGALAQPGKGHGNGNGNDKRGGPPAAAQAHGKKADRGPGPAQQMQRGKPDKGPQKAAEKDSRGPDMRKGNGNGPGVKRGGPDRRVERRPDKQVERRVERRSYDRTDRQSRAYVDRDRYRSDRAFFDRDRSRDVVTGCPPGLAKKYNGCMPPGLAKKQRQTFYGYDYRPRLFGLSHYGDGRYYYGDGYLMRLGGNGGIAGYIPLLGGALSIGNRWPSAYDSYSVPDYYVDYYGLGPRSSYRYADDVIYRVAPENSAIMSIAALLTGDDIAIGQPMPRGYDVYNVPYAYRDRYYDTPQAHYRYSDGYVYRIDPETQLVAAAIDLLI